MNICDLTPAIDTGDHRYVEAMFRALVDYPHVETIVCGGPGHLICALPKVIEALDGNPTVMPRDTCAALELPPGATYADGAARARETRHQINRTFLAAHSSRLLEA